MGLFSSKKKIVVNCSVQPLFDESTMPNSVRRGVVQHLLTDLPLVPTVAETFYDGLGVKGMSAFGWAKSQNYAYGIPQSGVVAPGKAQPEVEAQIQALYGTGSALDYYFMGPLNSFHHGWDKLVMANEYNPSTNILGKLTSTLGTTVYLADLVAEYTTATVDYALETGSLEELEAHAPYANWGPRLSQAGWDNTREASQLRDVGAVTANTIHMIYEYAGTTGMVKSLLHFDLPESSSSIVDEGAATWTVANGAAVTTTASKFGGSSLGLSEGSYISSSANTAFQLNNNFTIDFWMKLDGLPSTEQGIWLNGSLTSDNQRIQMTVGPLGELTFRARNATETSWNVTSEPGTITSGQMQHVAAIRYGTKILVLVDGEVVAFTTALNTPSPNQVMHIGIARHEGAQVTLNGWIDEFRVTHGTRALTRAAVPTAPGTITEAPIIQGSSSLTLDPDAEERDYHQARITTPTGGLHFFTYEDGSGVYPKIDEQYGYDVTKSGTHFPFVYFRYNWKNLAKPALEGTKAYKDSKQYCGKLGINYQMVADAIYADSDLSDVINSMLIFGVRVDATTPVESEYLFKHFNLIYTAAQEYGTSVKKVYQVQDRKYQMTFQFSGITKTTHTGTLTLPGRYMVPLKDGDSVTYRRQVDENTYEAITVTGMMMRYRVSGRYGDVAKVGDKECLLPVDRAVLLEMSVRKKEELIARSVHLMTNTYQEIKTKWYQSTWFKWFIIVLAIVITIVSFGGLSAVAAALVAFVSAGLVYIVTTLVVMLVKALVVQVLVKAFIDLAGLENSIIAAVLMIAASFFAPGAGTPNPGMLSQALLAAGNNMVQQVGTGFGEELKSIQEEMQAFAADSQQKWDELQAKRAEEFGWSDGVKNDYVTLAPMLLFGETPNDFYLRTAHVPNPGPYLLTSMHDFVAQKVRLPELIDVLNEDGSESATV